MTCYPLLEVGMWSAISPYVSEEACWRYCHNLRVVNVVLIGFFLLDQVIACCTRAMVLQAHSSACSVFFVISTSHDVVGSCGWVRCAAERASQLSFLL